MTCHGFFLFSFHESVCYSPWHHCPQTGQQHHHWHMLARCCCKPEFQKRCLLMMSEKLPVRPVTVTALDQSKHVYMFHIVITSCYKWKISMLHQQATAAHTKMDCRIPLPNVTLLFTHSCQLTLSSDVYLYMYVYMYTHICLCIYKLYIFGVLHNFIKLLNTVIVDSKN